MTIAGVEGGIKTADHLADRPFAPSFRSIAVAIIGLGILGAIGLIAGDRPIIGLAAAGAVLIIGLSAVRLTALPLVSMATLVVVQRAGGTLSVSDLILFVAVFPAMILVLPQGVDRATRSVLWYSLIYQVSILFTLIANPYKANIVEWAHELLLLAGAVVVGYTIGRWGSAKLGLSLFLLACAGIAILALIAAAQQLGKGSLQPVFLNFPYYMHKNVIGDILAFGAVLAYARPEILGWGRRWTALVATICALGVLAAQSKQGLVSLVIGVVILVLRPGQARKRSKAILLPLIPLGIFVYTVTKTQAQSSNTFNAVHQRLTWYQQSLDLWQQHPIFGVGLRFWYLGKYPAFQPPNAELEVLTSAGILGMAGFLIMFAGILWVLWHIEPDLGTLAFVMVLMRFVQGQLDLFWVTVQVSVPFAIAGICLGALELQRQGPVQLSPLRAVRAMRERLFNAA